MKRILGMLVILCMFYFIIQVGFRYLGSGHTVNYEIKGNNYLIEVNEKATFKTKGEFDSYYFTFKVNNKTFPFLTYKTFNKNDRVVKNVEYFKNDNYECIYPIFKDEKQISDILCYYNGILYNYHDLQNKSGELQKFAKDMEKYGYDFTHFVDDTGKEIADEDGQIVIYPKNIAKNHYIGIDNYAGIYLINNYLESKPLYNIKVFSNDCYEKIIESRASRYYVTADYNSTYDFNTFHVVDLVYNDQKTIKYHSTISFNSYIQGSVDGSIYLFDKNSKKQYKIDPKAGTVVEIGNEQTGIKYYNFGKWEHRKAVDAVNTPLYFNLYSVESEDYERVDKVGNDLSGYYYYYKKNGNEYQVYRSTIKDQDIKTYLFTTTNINEISYLRDYVYYKEGNHLKYYQDMTGIRTIAYDKEFEFNNSLHYYIYYSTK